jgi:hypothetical protein
MVTTNKLGKAVAALAIAGMATFSLAACGDDASNPKRLTPIASIDALSGKTTAIKLDPGFLDALGTLKLTPGVLGTAKLTAGSLIFPITGGNVDYFKPGTVSPYVVGQIQHEGSGLSLTGGGITVSLSNFNVDPGVQRVYGDVEANGKVVVKNAYLFRLDGATLKPLQTKGSTAILEGTKVFISPVAADLLNTTYSTKAVTGDLLVGIAKITVNTK